jgi:hypothetical protein
VSSPSPLDFEVVRLLARSRLSDERRAALDAAVARGPSWTHVVELARAHSVVPLLDAHLREAMPADAAAAVHKAVRRYSIRVLFLAAEMAALTRAFRDAGVPFLVMKGPTMAEAYGSTARRPYVDNDVLVRREDFAAVERVLVEAGFTQRERTDRQQAGYLHVHGETSFARRTGGLVSMVDVHTRLLPLGFAFDGPFEALHSRSRPVAVAGEEAPALGWTDLFLTLSVNALKDQWARLRLATDFAEVAALIGDWDELLERAAQGQCLRATYVAVLVSAREVGAEYPPRVLAAARADRRAGRLAEAAGARLREAHERPVMRSRDRVLFNVLAPDGLRGQARYAWYTAVRRATEWYVDPDGARS